MAEIGRPVLVEVERSGFVESRHRGTAIALGADGSVVASAGPVDELIFPRSTVKPFQAIAMLRNGLDLRGELLALAAASHSGEPFHVAGAERILSSAGLTAEALRCPADWPLDVEAERELVRAGGTRSRLHMNCSGKHAAMLLTCVRNGWPTESYLEPGHPLQRAVRAVIEEHTGETITVAGTDGCGAPLFAITPRGLARAFHGLTGSPVVEAMRAHPEWTSGTRRDEYRVSRLVPGLLLKCGAEGVDAFCLPDGRTGVVKIDDGAMRARTPVTVALLRAVGVTDPALDELATTPLTGGAAVVGAIRLAAGLDLTGS
ncbi:asparaginase [Actinocorallia longicatena]|uniref:Asparaginase n=1 Tax=Actinocorallia longicatena TaxID=111803 RepID=A0ABP6QE47_9ACTN